MKIIKLTNPKVLEETVKTLQNGGIVIYPTETCYGVGVDATNSAAVSKVLKYKKRPEGKPISIGCFDEKMASKYVDLNNTAKNIYRSFLPGPVTVISNSKGMVDKRLESEKGTLGIRIPNYPKLLEIIKMFGKPITTTSANSSGKKTPYSTDDIFENISVKQKDLIDLVIDAGELPHNLPSTVIDTTSEELKTYRKGGISFDEKNSDLISTKSVNETINLGEKLMQDNLKNLKTSPVIFLLRGELGAGKTQLTKGIAKALEINRTIKSPTYTYVDEYKYKLADLEGKLYHVDAWRIENKKDLEILGLDDWLKPNNVLAIEWPDIVLNLLGENIFEGYKVINLSLDGNEESREIRISK